MNGVTTLKILEFLFLAYRNLLGTKSFVVGVGIGIGIGGVCELDKQFFRTILYENNMTAGKSNTREHIMFLMIEV